MSNRPKRPTPINIQFSKLDRGQFTLPTSYIDVAEHNAYITAIEQERDEYESELQAVMHSVDKWFDKAPSDNPATRAADAREIALRAIETAQRERDEATELLDVTSSALSEWCRTPMHRVDRMVEETYTINAKIAELLARIEEVRNDHGE